MEKYAVITGASSGIGKEFARQLARRHYSLILVARREERLLELQEELSTDCIIIKADLSKEAECYRVYEEIKDKDIEVFINNAGFGDCSYFVDGDLSKELDMIHVNIRAVHIFTKLMVRKMRNGYLLNVASVAGLMPGGPYMATYYATKAYVTSFTRAVARELKEHKHPLYIGCLCPGPVNTEFNQVADVEFALRGISAKQCVSYALKKMYQRKVTIIPSTLVQTAAKLSHLAPVALCIYIASMQQKRKIR